MYTYLEITSGAQQGRTYLLRPNLRLGSGDCEIQIDDPELPAHHSQIMFDGNEQMVLVCTNAVYEIFTNGRSSKRVVLEDGQHLRVGGTTLQVVISSKQLQGALDPLKPQSANAIDLERSFQQKKSVASTLTALVDELNLLAAKAPRNNDPGRVRFFKHPVRISVEQGAQAEDEFVFTWGPRDFGPLALEFPIEFPPFPGILFTISPSETGEMVFSTKHPDFSRVSGQRETTCVMADGDRIEVGNSVLLIEYLKEIGNHDED